MSFLDAIVLFTFQNGCNLAWPLSPFPGNRQSNQSICCNNEEKGRGRQQNRTEEKLV